MVHSSEVTDLMDQMMQIDIFHPMEKLRMLKDEEKTFLDPNVVMDARHRILRENLNVSPARCSVLAEAKRLLTEEESRELYMKKQQRFLERELKRFETELRKSRPKLSKPYTCKKKNLAPSDDENFWETFKKIKNKTVAEEKTEKNNGNRKRSTDIIQKKSAISGIDNCSAKVKDNENEKKMEHDIPCIGSIKVTIKDKSNFESETQRLCLLRKCFDALKRNATEQRRIRDIKIKIRQNVISNITRKYFDIWRTRTKDKKNIQKENEIREISDERRIEMFIDAITERQKELMKSRKPKIRDGNPVVKEPSNATTKKKSVYCKRVVVESPAQCRLNAQKLIIEKQRAKLAEQNRIIEELKLKEMQKEISRASKETMDIAKETFTHLGQRTRRTLVHLMQQSGYRDESLTISHRPSDPPKFLLRMEARAEARRKRIKLAEESRRMKLEEQKRKEEVARIEEEQTKRRLQQEALAEARRLRREREQNRLREIERFKRLNGIADEFYQKYLLRRYIMEPLINLVEQKRSNIKKADDHYREKLTRKIFVAWKRETEIRCEIKVEIAESFYNQNLMTRIFGEWRQMAKEANLKYQVATDFRDMKLSEKYFKLWQVIILKLKARYEEKKKVATSHYESKLKARYFSIWRKYLTIVGNIKESEKRKDELRQLVQKVIPDFDPKQRGVALED